LKGYELSDSAKNSTTTRRKIAAGGLVALAIAGLGLASASELNLNADAATFQAGNTAQTNADCQGNNVIKVSLSTPEFEPGETNPWTVSKVTFSNISAACVGKSVQAAYSTDSASTWVKLANVTAVPAVDESGTASLQQAVPATVDAEDITNWALTIYSADE
jgi:hypothetical protein